VLVSDPDGGRPPDAGYLERLNSNAARRIPQELWPIVRRKLDQIEAATKLEDLMIAVEDCGRVGYRPLVCTVRLHVVLSPRSRPWAVATIVSG
jgi:hypothetical protein